MIYTITYSEYMEFEESIEAISIEEAKKKFEEAVSKGECEPVTARVMEYVVDPEID